MRRGLLWRTLLILVIVGFCGFRLWPPSEKIKLGLDLKGGMHLVLSADVKKVIDNAFLNFSEDVKRALARKRIPIKDMKIDKENFSIKVSLQDPSQIDAAYKVLSDFPTLEVHEIPPDALEIVYPEKERKTLERHIIAQAVDNIRQRVDRFGVAEATVQPRGENRIIVELPGVHERERVRQLIGKTAKLDFHLGKLPDETWNILKRIDEALNGQLLNYVHKYEMRIYVKPEDVDKVEKLLATPEAKKITPAGFEFNIGKAEVLERIGTIRPIYLIEKRPAMGGESIRNAWKQPYGLGYVVSIEFDKEGAVKFEKLTKAHVGEPLAIVLDGVVQSAPIIEEAIRRTSTPIIKGDFTEQEAGDLAIMLKAGALPASIIIEEERSVGPSLGADSIKQGIRATIIGALLVTLFMILYYGVGGIIADIALALNLVIILGVLAALGATLTLPGIAGIILTIGMAVDANVLIFERTREELRAGKGIAAAIDAGYKRAFITILDANITTLITALILLQFTTGPIKGFATTLSIGILSSMFTAIVVTRVIFDFLIDKVGMKRFLMLQMVRRANIPFVRIRKIAFIGSLAAIVIGMGAFTSRGQDNYGIDFTGGVYLQREFSEPVAIEDIRSALGELGLGESIIQQFDEGRGVIIRSAVQEHDYKGSRGLWADRYCGAKDRRGA